MLDPWIIEEIRRREEELTRDGGRRLEIPVERPTYDEHGTISSDDDTDRGVVVIDM